HNIMASVPYDTDTITMLISAITNTATQKLCLFILPSKLMILVQKSIRGLTSSATAPSVVTVVPSTIGFVFSTYISLPHLKQNLASSGFFAPHLVQNIYCSPLK